MLPPEVTLIHDGVLLSGFFENVFVPHPPDVVAVIEIDDLTAFVTSAIDLMVSLEAAPTVILNDSSSVVPLSSVTLTVTLWVLQAAELGTVPVMLPPEVTLIHDGVLPSGFFENVFVPHPPVAVAVIEIDDPTAFATSAIDAIVNVGHDRGVPFTTDDSPGVSVAFARNSKVYSVSFVRFITCSVVVAAPLSDISLHAGSDAFVSAYRI